MKVFLTGGTGFVGSEVLRQLTEAGHTVRCLVREGSEANLAVRQGVEVHRGDAVMEETLAGAVAGCDAVIHLIGIIREFPARGITFKRLHVEATTNLVAEAEKQGVRRFLHMSANGARPGADSVYHQTKWQAEETVRASSLDWTVFRPSLIFGSGDQFVNLIAPLIRLLPVMPVVGSGQYRMSPVAVQDVAAGFVRALETPQAVGKSYACCGPDEITYDEILDTVGHAIGIRKVRKIHTPVCLVKPVVSIGQHLPSFPLTLGQLTMLLEGNCCDPASWATTFGITPQTFAAGIAQYLHLRK